MKIKKGDTVQVLRGKDRGATGKVLKAYPENGTVLVEGVNRIKRHTKAETSSRGSQSGGIVTQEAPLNASKVMVVAGGTPTRVGYRQEEVTGEDGRVRRTRVRISRRTGEDI